MVVDMIARLLNETEKREFFRGWRKQEACSEEHRTPCRKEEEAETSFMGRDLLWIEGESRSARTASVVREGWFCTRVCAVY